MIIKVGESLLQMQYMLVELVGSAAQLLNWISIVTEPFSHWVQSPVAGNCNWLWLRRAYLLVSGLGTGVAN